MSVAVPERVEAHEEFDRSPAVSHLLDIGHEGPDLQGFCGAQLLGVPAPSTAPRCAECEALADAFFRVFV